MLKELPAPEAYEQMYEGQLIHIQLNPNASAEQTQRLLVAVSHLQRRKINFIRSQTEIDAPTLAEKLDQHTNQIIFLGYGSGIEQVRDGQAEIISCLCQEKIALLLSENKPTTITIPDAIANILPLIDKLLPLVGKIVVTDDPEKEIENCFGAGTLFFDPAQLEFSPMKIGAEQTINNHMDEYFEKEGVFKKREVAGDTFMLRIKGSPISACTFFHHPNADGTEVIEIGKLWTGVARNGLSQYTLEKALLHLSELHIDPSNIFAITKEANALSVFERSGFTTESLRALQLSRDPRMGDYLRNYQLADGDDRNVHFLA